MTNVKRENIHKVFNPFSLPTLTKSYVYLKNKYPNDMLLIMTDHLVDNDFFWELNSYLIDVNMKLLSDDIKVQPIIPLPYDSNNVEFANLLSKMKQGTMLIDQPTFDRLTFKERDPFYFYSNRLVIHKTGEISFYAGRKF